MVVGHSSGGHLAATVARDVPISTLVLLAPVVDLSGLDEHPVGRPSRDAFIGTHPEDLAAASPLHHVPRLPHVIAHDPGDDTVPEAATAAYVTALDAAGVPVTRIDAAGAGHLRIVDPEGPVWQAVVEAIER